MLRIRELGEWREEYEQDIGILALPRFI